MQKNNIKEITGCLFEKKMKINLKENLIKTKQKYFEEYKSNHGEFTDEEKRKEKEKKMEKALEKALDTRKFEIELYWKRATYFATFIGLMFTSYYVVASAAQLESEEARYEMLLFISAIGVFSSLCWFLVNKGSKYWQENWEFHVDLLEDDVMGPLYKTTKYCNNQWLDGKKIRWSGIRHGISPFKSYKYSVGKIGIYLSFMIVIAWLALFIKQFCNNIKYSSLAECDVWIIKFVISDLFVNYTAIIVTVALIISVVLLLWKCKSTGYNGQDKEESSFTKREIIDVPTKKET